MMMRFFKIAVALALLPVALWANTAPTVVIQSAVMRPDTTLMDIHFRVNDPDDATVKVRALAFINGVRSFSNVVQMVTFVEGTDANIGDAVAANTDLTLTWDVPVDWDIDLAEVKIEIMARDERGLLPFDWVTIPATDETEELTISLNAPSDQQILDAFFWQYADKDPALTLVNGILQGATGSGGFGGISLVSGDTIQHNGGAYILKKMNLDPATRNELSYTDFARRSTSDTSHWYAFNRPYNGFSVVVGWGLSGGFVTPTKGVTDNIESMDAGQNFAIALLKDGTVSRWGSGAAVPENLKSVIKIAAGRSHSLALKDDGTVVAWGGLNRGGEISVPSGLSNVVAVAAGLQHSLALKNDGSVVAWGTNNLGQCTVPAGLTNVVAVAAGGNHSYALTTTGTVIGWGTGNAAPTSAMTISAISVKENYGLALNSDGTVLQWGSMSGYSDFIPMPENLSNIVAVSAGGSHGLALQADGTVIAWGYNKIGSGSATSNQARVPAGLHGVSQIAAGSYDSLALKVDVSE